MAQGADASEKFLSLIAVLPGALQSFWPSLAELEQKSSKHIRFTLSDTAQAARILERNFHETHFSIQDDHNLRLHNMELPVGKIVTAFVENGLEVSEAHTCEESLEDYFKRVTGGEGIA